MLMLGFAQIQPESPDSSKLTDEPENAAKPGGAAVVPVGQPLDDEEDQPTAAEEISDTLMTLTPWAISIVLHLGMVLLALFVVWSTVHQPDEEELIVPSVRLSATPGAPLRQQTTKRVNTRSRTTRRVTQTTPTRSTLQSRVNAKTALIGVAGGAAKSSPFGTDIAAAGDFSANFMGSGGNARHIAFLIDASGSLIDSLPFVIRELQKTIQQLSDKQSFTVMFFQGDTVLEVPPRGLKKADAKTKQRVSEWIDLSNHNVVPGGRSDPVKAIRVALKYKPQLLYLLSDNITGLGRYEIDQRRLLVAIAKANISGTKINTIQYIYHDPLTKVGLPSTLELISKQSGGVSKFVDAKELRLK